MKKLVYAFIAIAGLLSLNSCSEDSLITEPTDSIERLTKEQNSLLDYLEEQRVAAIQGAAGTGKTWLAVEKAQKLAGSGKVLFL